MTILAMPELRHICLNPPTTTTHPLQSLWPPEITPYRPRFAFLQVCRVKQTQQHCVCAVISLSEVTEGSRHGSGLKRTLSFVLVAVLQVIKCSLSLKKNIPVIAAGGG